ncbi:hypothetical protein [Negadavirga shengliensis]|uniref:Outer membrane protein beta-barrel domain-containing protein n=1 Tax=Negadavirga shengliensis TaxID=1389218 RepID=A0ABV9T077_9BACT
MMRKIYVFIVSFILGLHSYAQEVNDSNKYLFLNYGAGMEMNYGLGQNIAVGYHWGKQELSYRYVHGQEWTFKKILKVSTDRLPPRFIRSHSLMYGYMYKERVSASLGVAYTSGSARGEKLQEYTISFFGNEIKYYEEIRYISIGLAYGLNYELTDFYGIVISVFTMGEFNPERFYNVSGINFQYRFAL